MVNFSGIQESGNYNQSNTTAVISFLQCMNSCWKILFSYNFSIYRVWPQSFLRADHAEYPKRKSFIMRIASVTYVHRPARRPFGGPVSTE